MEKLGFCLFGFAYFWLLELTELRTSRDSIVVVGVLGGTNGEDLVGVVGVVNDLSRDSSCRGGGDVAARHGFAPLVITVLFELDDDVEEVESLIRVGSSLAAGS